MRLCEEEGCEEKHLARGLCREHYGQQYPPNRDMEKRRAQQAAWRARNREKLRAEARAWHERNPGRQAEYDSRRDRPSLTDEQRAKARETSRRWRQENPDLYRAQRQYPTTKAALRAAGHARRGAGSMDKVTRQWTVVLMGDPCVYCGGEATTLDHIVPIKSYGRNEYENLAPACRSCNSSKGPQSLLAFLLREVA